MQYRDVCLIGGIMEPRGPFDILSLPPEILLLVFESPSTTSSDFLESKHKRKLVSLILMVGEQIFFSAGSTELTQR